MLIGACDSRHQAPGCLCTFPNAPSCPGLEGKHLKLGQIATTVARPDRGYGGTYNYFDPDNFFSMTALIYSGEPFLQEQARTVIERSGSFLCIGDIGKTHKCTYGQLPHHFEGDVPTFLALSGATQTGPNTFWVRQLRHLFRPDIADLFALYHPTHRMLCSTLCPCLLYADWSFNPVIINYYYSHFTPLFGLPGQVGPAVRPQHRQHRLAYGLHADAPGRRRLLLRPNQRPEPPAACPGEPDD